MRSLQKLIDQISVVEDLHGYLLEMPVHLTSVMTLFAAMRGIHYAICFPGILNPAQSKMGPILRNNFLRRTSLACN